MTRLLAIALCSVAFLTAPSGYGPPPAEFLCSDYATEVDLLVKAVEATSILGAFPFTPPTN